MAKLGGQKVGGRSKGTPNKKTSEQKEYIATLMRRKGYCPFESMIEIAQKSMVKEDYVLAGQMAKELAQYKAPKLRSIEVSGRLGLMTRNSITKRYDGSIDPELNDSDANVTAPE